MKMKSIRFRLLLLGFTVLFFLNCQTKEITSAKVYKQQDNWEKAKEQLLIAVELYPNDSEAHFLLGEAYGHYSEWKKMNKEFNASLALNTQFAPHINNIREKNWVEKTNKGVAAIKAEHVKSAIEQFAEAVIILSDRADGFRNLAIAYEKSDNLPKARENYLKYLELSPQDTLVMMQLAQIYFRENRFQDVVDLMQKALEIDEGNADAIINQAMAFDLLGKDAEARETYEKAMEKSPNDYDLLLNLGHLYLMNDEYNKTIELLNKVIANNPQDFNANLNVGNAYLQMADELRKKLVDMENNGDTITKEARDNMVSLYSKAVPYLEKAVSIESDQSNIWNNLGVAYVNCGDAVKGEQAFKNAEALSKE